MIKSFGDQGTEDIFNGVNSKRARKTLPVHLHDAARQKLDLLNYATILSDLRIPPGNQLESLRGDREGQHSIRINRQYRICFRWRDESAEDVEITDYH
jgi:proteic killer suppression protein